MFGLNEFQTGTKRFWVAPIIGHPVIYPSLGLTGEAGELCNKIKKIFRDDGGELTPERREQIIHELGDCLYYVAALATAIDIPLEDVARQNLAMLDSRSKRGTLSGDGDNR